MNERIKTEGTNENERQRWMKERRKERIRTNRKDGNERIREWMKERTKGRYLCEEIEEKESYKEMNGQKKQTTRKKRKASIWEQSRKSRNIATSPK